MPLISYLALDTRRIDVLRERLAGADPACGLLVARTLPELIDHLQTLPVRLIILDEGWPREVWTQCTTALRALQLSLPVLALADGAGETEWWTNADDLLRLDEPTPLFLHRLRQPQATITELIAPPPPPPPVAPAPPIAPVVAEAADLLSAPQFRRFAEIFAGHDARAIADAYVVWVQQTCRTSRVVLLLRAPETGVFTCHAQRGLPPSLAEHCVFPQTAPLCRWLTSFGCVLTPDQTDSPLQREAAESLRLMQAIAAVPIVLDGQLVGILGIGPRLMGGRYDMTDLEALFALSGQVAAAIQHDQLHCALQNQQQMTEHMLSVLPTGTVLLDTEQRIVFVNAAAAEILGQSPAALHGSDMRALPAPLSELAYAALVRRQDLPRREAEIPALGRPLAVSAFALATTPPTAMLLFEDLTAIKRLEEEHDRRINLEVLTNLVHYLAHELRNPLVSLSTFTTLAPMRADDPEFRTFCETVLSTDIGRVNLILEQLLVLTDHLEMRFRTTELGQLFDRLTNTEEMRAAVTMALPIVLPDLEADPQRLETALTCLLRTAIRLSSRKTPVALTVTTEQTMLAIRIETPVAHGTDPERLLNPWTQLVELAEDEVDLGLATARYIIEQHNGTLHVAAPAKTLTLSCRLPLSSHDDDISLEESHDIVQNTRGRRSARGA